MSIVYLDSEIVVNYHDAVIYGSDLKLLQSPTAWLNDACIHFCFTQLKQKQQQQPNDILFDPSVLSFFMNQCSDEEDIQEFVCGLSMPKNGRFFLPVNDNMVSDTWSMPEHTGCHWSLLVVTFRCNSNANDEYDVSYLHFDSVKGSGNSKVATSIANKFHQTVFRTSPSAGVVHQATSPQQTNGHDCGLHVLVSTQALLGVEMNETTATGLSSSQQLQEVYEESLRKRLGNQDTSTETVCLSLRQQIATDILTAAAAAASSS